MVFIKTAFGMQVQLSLLDINVPGSQPAGTVVCLCEALFNLTALGATTWGASPLNKRKARQ